MSDLPVLLRQPPSSPLVLPVSGSTFGAKRQEYVPPRRDRIWDLSPNLHCSVIGTCLSTGELRQLFTKLNSPDAKTASDHVLHSRAVLAAGKQDVAGKLLNKMLHKRHETHVKRFAKAKTTEEVRALWVAALDRGDIPGAYWAVLTHPQTDHRLVQEVFGEVHMLSHLVGMSNRADIARLRYLERELGDRDEKISRQEARLQRMAQERDELSRRVDELDRELKLRQALPPVAVRDPAEETTSLLKRRLEDEQARSAQLAARLADQEEASLAREARLQEIEQHASALQAELASAEASLAALDPTSEETAGQAPDLLGKRFLYVGGRPNQIEHLKALAARLGGVLLTHDGGIEDNTALLPGLISQSDAAFFPVDCVSHHGAGQVKRLCREAGKPFVPLRSASLASFVTAIGSLEQLFPLQAEG